MEFRWRCQDADGREVSGAAEGFDDQSDAEEWLGLHWQELLDQEVHSVTLLHGEAEVYGPMSLHPAGS
jgi:hypothetical protein